MPRNTPPTVHRWADLPHDRPMPLLERWRIVGEHAMISHVLLRKGCVVPMHAHDNEQFACVLTGELRFVLNAENGPDRREVVVRAGEVLLLPANVPHAAEAIQETLVLDIFSPPSERTGIDRD